MNHSGILRWCGEVHFPLALVTSRKLARTRVTRALEGLPARGLSFVYRSTHVHQFKSYLASERHMSQSVC